MSPSMVVAVTADAPQARRGGRYLPLFTGWGPGPNQAGHAAVTLVVAYLKGVSTVKQTFGPGPHRLLCNGRPVGACAVADTARTRRKGLLGTDAVEGALWITRCPSVHMVGMRYPIDVAVLDKTGTVLRVATLRPWVGMTRPRFRAASTVEASAGALSTWGVHPGDNLSVEYA